MSVILYSGWYSPELCQRHPNKVFVFGDNMRGFGKGGQAVIRDEPNAFGVPTKRLPSMVDEAFFREGDSDALDAILNALEELWGRLKDRDTVVIPTTKTGKVSLGLERAQLDTLAPSLYATIAQHVEEMVDSYGGRRAEDETELIAAY
ncbi:hypothetical protein LAV_00115 [Sphingobium phage Lacusarx]|uniref:DUF7831 domain-containing protein n=1 Tax=Sphingobium phage Lacusarx TaxID=1980139 RepID=A0A1W6DWV0_9CAUD|nr:hypothetical protein FDH44_gp188 [Sphingobium phage Lacusarx]ARK07490.1 hypothetical protein LAV_00115 [Sphingobium phage Lacusarx]